MGKSWNMKNWPKVMESCDQPCNFTNFALILYQICTIFAITRKHQCTNVESLYFLMFSAQCRKYIIKKRDGHGKWRNDFSGKSHVKILCQVCGNPDIYAC